MLYKRLSCLFLGIFLLFLSSGCLFVLGGGAGAGAALWYKGELRQTVSRDKDAVYEAAKEATSDMGFVLLKAANRVEKAEIKCRKPDNTPVYIDISHISNRSCEISIRIGFMGDEAESRRILAGIYDRL
jgi:hypothetical protein